MNNQFNKRRLRNPLTKRLPRELKSEIGKYIVIFAFITGIISLISGFLVADDSMITAYNNGFTKYNIEDGNFELETEADHTLVETLEKEDVKIYSNFYVEENVSQNDSTLRIFANRTEIDLVCLMEGKLPEAENEIAIDRMYADNNSFQVGDTLDVGNRKCVISGLVALSDYSALFSNSSDMMFDAVKFGVAITTKDGFEQFGDTHLHYNYGWKYKDAPADNMEAKELSEDFLTVLNKNALLTNYIPAYSNQAIHFTGDDMGSDKNMFIIFLYIIIIIIGFVFAVTTSNTITKEAAVIGTLRASGYKRGELIRHYLAMPMITMFVGAIIGNILGYTCLKDFFASMYYGSYSLPTYETLWNADAFIITTVVPMVIMFLINLGILTIKLRISPLKFIRRDLSRRKNKRAFPLSSRMKIFTRFLIRIILQNLPNYLTMFLGVLFANFIMFFGFFLLPMLNHFSEEITSNMVAQYQYVLKAPMETKNGDAEKYAAKVLKTAEGKYKSEEVNIYGIVKDSDYIDCDFEENQVYVSDGYAKKFNIKAGDEITLKEEYGTDEYTFTVQGIYKYPSANSIWMDYDSYIEVFDVKDGGYNGYFSDSEITDIDEKYIATSVTEEDLTKVSRQLKVSMGNMTYMLTAFGLIMSMALIYLLSKVIIERNEQSISMVKILGFRDGEIDLLYILSTSIVFVCSVFLSLPICNWLLEKLLVVMMSDYPGWLPYYVAPSVFVKIIVLSIACYLVVLLFQMLKIKRIPKSDALKNQE